jgi:endonuclease YncB( thermonuclease family)
MLPGFVFEWPTRLVEWHDGDTCRALVDRGRGEMWDTPIRLAPLYAPELADPGGTEAAVFADSICPPGTLMRARCRPLGKSGRWTEGAQMSLGRLLASLTFGDGRDFGAVMIAAGHASATPGPGWGRSIPGLESPAP